MFVRNASNGRRFWGPCKECRMNLCSETLPLTMLPSVAGLGALDKDKCRAKECGERLVPTRLPSVLARKAGTGRRPWSSSEECTAKV